MIQVQLIYIPCALVNSRLDYANAVLYGTSAANIAKLQLVQNALARVVTLKKRTVHIRPVLKDLHWLPINYRIDYKVASLVHKVRSTGSPAYLRWSLTTRLQTASVVKAAFLTKATTCSAN